MRNVKLLSIIVLTSIAAIIGSSAIASAAGPATPFDQINAAIATLTTNLNNEIARAMSAESTLTTNLGNEIARATGAESTLTTTLNAEIADRKQGDANTLSSANSYTDTQTAAEQAARKQGDADTLSSAKSYTDQQIATQSAATSMMSANQLCNPSTGTVNTKFMTLTGAIQGQIKGDVTQKGKEGDIAIIVVCDAASRQFDPATGLLTGPRAFQPFTILKITDSASPKLYTALTTGEKLSVKIDFFRTDQLGKELNVQTITLTDALITSINEVKVDTADKQNIYNFGEYEQISFTFQKINWTWNDGGITYSDNWVASP